MIQADAVTARKGAAARSLPHVMWLFRLARRDTSDTACVLWHLSRGVRTPSTFYARLAHSVEQRICNAKVVCSIQTVGTTSYPPPHWQQCFCPGRSNAPGHFFEKGRPMSLMAMMLIMFGKNQNKPKPHEPVSKNWPYK
jgi:hypothetical protein